MKKITKLVSIALAALAISGSFISCKSKEQKAADLSQKAAEAAAKGDMDAYKKYMKEAADLVGGEAGAAANSALDALEGLGF